MESIEKLRELASDINESEIIGHLNANQYAYDCRWLDSWHREFDRAIEAVEREIADKYMLLPVVDGRPVHIGDELEWTDGYEPYERFTVGMIGRTYCDEPYQDFAETHEHGISFGCCRWPGPERVKKLLEEYAGKRFARSNMGLDIEGLADDYAAKIREAVSADE